MIVLITPLPPGSTQFVFISALFIHPEVQFMEPLVDAVAQADGLAPTSSCSRAAFRNNNAAPTHSAAKNPVAPKISRGQIGAVEPNPAISAITATNT